MFLLHNRMKKFSCPGTCGIMASLWPWWSPRLLRRPGQQQRKYWYDVLVFSMKTSSNLAGLIMSCCFNIMYLYLHQVKYGPPTDGETISTVEQAVQADSLHLPPPMFANRLNEVRGDPQAALKAATQVQSWNAVALFVYGH